MANLQLQPFLLKFRKDSGCGYHWLLTPCTDAALLGLHELRHASVFQSWSCVRLLCPLQPVPSGVLVIRRYMVWLTSTIVPWRQSLVGKPTFDQICQPSACHNLPSKVCTRYTDPWLQATSLRKSFRHVYAVVNGPSARVQPNGEKSKERCRTVCDLLHEALVKTGRLPGQA